MKFVKPAARVVIQKVRVKRGLTQAHPKHKVLAESPTTKRRSFEEHLPDGVSLLKLPAEIEAQIRTIAQYEERSNATVRRSLVLLGLRVYARLARDLPSAFGPAHVEVTDEEIDMTIKDIRAEAPVA